MLLILYTVKPVLSGHSKIDKKILMTNGSLIKVESIAEGCDTFDLHLGIICLEKQFVVFLKVAVLHRFYCIVCS